MIMDRDRLTTLLEEVVSELEKAPAAGAGRAETDHPLRRRLQPSDIYSVIEEAEGGGRDDLCTGSRYFSGLIDEKADSVSALADRLIERVVCPAKHGG